MYFKFLVILISVITLLNSSCRWVGEAQYKPQIVEITNSTENCFENLSTTIEAYLKSEIEDEKIVNLFGCTQRSVDDFMLKTAEKDPTRGYSRVEIQSLLNTFLLKNSNTTDSERYARMLLIFKRALIGGEPDFLSRKEWTDVKSILPTVIDFFINTRPYMKFYYFYDKAYYREQNHDFGLLNLGHIEFEKRLSRFINFLKSKDSRVNINEIQYLKDELVKIDSLTKVEPLFDEIIKIFHSFPISQHQENWVEILRIAEHGLRVMTYVKKSSLQDQGYFVPSGGLALAALVRSVIDTFELAYRVNSSLSLSQEMVERFVLSLNASGLFFNRINNPDVLQRLVSNIGRQIFSENSRGWEVSYATIDDFKFMFNRWVSTLIISLNGDPALRNFANQYEQLLFTDVQNDLKGEKEGEDVFNNIVNVSPINIAFPGAEYKVNFLPSTQPSAYSEAISKFYKSMMANVVMFVFDTYGKSESRLEYNSKKHISEQTATRLYSDIREITVAEGLGSPLSCESGSRTFLEANLFGYSSNGNDRIEVDEGLEWITMATSSSSVASKLFNDIAAIDGCVLPGNSTFQNRPYLKKQCVKSFIIENYPRYFDHMPNLLNYIKAESKIEDFYENLFEVIRTCGNRDLPVSYDEMVYSVTLLGYIEALFYRYDVEKDNYFGYFVRPRNDLLEIDELNLAFKERFRSVLQRMAKLRNQVDLSDSHTKHLFKKLLIYKKIPPTPVGTLQGLQWLLTDQGVSVKPLNRIDIYKIFNSILTSNDIPEASFNYCKDLTLAWEEYTQQQKFELKTPENVCEEAIRARGARR